MPVIKLSGNSDQVKLTRLAPSIPLSSSSLFGRHLKNSLEGKGECKKRPIAASGIFSLSILGTSSRW